MLVHTGLQVSLTLKVQSLEARPAIFPPFMTPDRLSFLLQDSVRQPSVIWVKPVLRRVLPGLQIKVYLLTPVPFPQLVLNSSKENRIAPPRVPSSSATTPQGLSSYEEGRIFCGRFSSSGSAAPESPPVTTSLRWFSLLMLCFRIILSLRVASGPSEKTVVRSISGTQHWLSLQGSRLNRIAPK